MSEATANLRKGGCIILLDVPPGSAITLDGVTRVTPSSSTTATAAEAAKSPLMSDASAPFHRGIWIISGIAAAAAAAAAAANSSSSREEGDADFHLLVVRAGMRKDNNATSSTTTNGGDCRTLPVGFVLGSPADDAVYRRHHHHHHHHHHDWIFARRYDPRTEEMSNESVDELTLNNMVAATGPGGELGKFVIPYDQFMGGRSAKHPNRNNGNDNNIDINNNENSLVPSWERRTSLIDSQYLRRCHALFHGNKIVPSSEKNDGESGSGGGGGTTATKDNTSADGGTNNNINNNNDDNNVPQKIIKDGASVSYPSIPCIDPTVNARRLAQHAGTRAYLSKLSPEKRTALLFGGWDGGGGGDAETVNPGEYVWKDVLSRHYGRSNENSSSEGEDAFLADVELSFLLFLFLECHASLEHWRDAVSMCSLSTAADDNATTATTTTSSMVIRHSQFYRKLLSVLHRQLSCIETEFFQDAEYSSGKDNFMIGALRRLCDACENGGKRKREGDDDNDDNNNNNTADGLKETSRRLRRLVRDRFGMDLDGPKDDGGDDDDCDYMEIDALAIDVGDEDGHDETGRTDSRDNQDDDSESEEEDGPVIVPYDQVEASAARSSLQPTKASMQTHGKEYPLLYAAMTPEEDEVMTCARILDEAKDVSLVREAAAYLEEVEAHRGAMF